MSLAQNPREMRRVSREEVCYRCEIAGPDFGPASALIVNISPLGCMIRCSKEVRPDMVVSFILPIAGRCEARIVWAIGGRIGLEFSRPIDVDPYLAMLDHLRRPGDEMGIY